MGVKNFNLQDITSRIILSLPSRFSREEETNVYKFFETLADTFKINTDKIDELITQTNLDTASGSYLDQYISGLAGFGRLNSTFQSILQTEDEFDIVLEQEEGYLYLPDFSSGAVETDGEYRDRYKSVLYTYNSTRTGLRQIIIDFFYEDPTDMYAGSKRGAYSSNITQHARYYHNDSIYSKYGAGGNTAFIGYIELTRKPDEGIIDILCNHLAAAKACGIKLYLKYPATVLDFNVYDSVIATDPLDYGSEQQLQSVGAGETLTYSVTVSVPAIIGQSMVGQSYIN